MAALEQEVEFGNIEVLREKQEEQELPWNVLSGD